MLMLRRWHRWTAVPAGIFLLWIAVTGIALHLDLFISGQPAPGSEPPAQAPPPPLPSNAELASMVERVADAARERPDLEVRAITINLGPDGAVVSAGPGGPPGGPQVRIDGTTGEAIAPPPAPNDYHFTLQNLHAGYQFGLTGQLLSILCGLSLAILAVTGLQIWWDMRRKRRKGAFFWK